MRIRTGLTFRIFMVSVLVFGALVVIGSTVVTIGERAGAMRALERDSSVLRERLSMSMREALWDFDRARLEAVIRSEMQDPRVRSILVWDDSGMPYLGMARDEAGLPDLLPESSEWPRQTEGVKPVFVPISRENVVLGTAEIGLDYGVVDDFVLSSIGSTVVRYLAVSLLGLVFLVLYVKLTVIDAVSAMAGVVARFSRKEFHARVGREAARDDELGELGRAFNRMAAVIQDHSLDLEGLVRERTSMLIESEKMAFLGGLTAGIAHEINTPVGIGVTAASHLEQRVHELSRELESGSLTKERLEAFFAEAGETANIMLANLKRTSDFVSSFKQMAVDQSSPAERLLNVRAWAEDVLFSLRPKLKHARHTIRMDIPPDLSWKGDPGLLSQILTNLIVNSLTHAFPDGKAGRIDISASSRNGKFVLDYSDDGVGIPRENLGRIFQPFFTTRGGKGGTGLGLYIIQSIASKLGGSVSCVSGEGHGVRFTVSLPFQDGGAGTETA